MVKGLRHVVETYIMFDEDGSGTIDRKEVMDMIKEKKGGGACSVLLPVCARFPPAPVTATVFGAVRLANRLVKRGEMAGNGLGQGWVHHVQGSIAASFTAGVTARDLLRCGVPPGVLVGNVRVGGRGRVIDRKRCRHVPS
jgi:hypothetical protein